MNNTEHVLRCVRDYIEVVACTCEFTDMGIPKFNCWKCVFAYNMNFVDAEQSPAPSSSAPTTRSIHIQTGHEGKSEGMLGTLNNNRASHKGAGE